jgi:hypothetical protein
MCSVIRPTERPWRKGLRLNRTQLLEIIMFVKVLKGWLLPIFLTLSIGAFAMGGWWLWAPVIGIMLGFMLGDALLPKDLTAPVESDSLLFSLPVYLVLPLLVVYNGILLWMFASGDVAQVGEWVRATLGVDLFAAREATTSWMQLVGGVLSAALLNGSAGTTSGHELTHRTSKPFDMIMGRLLLTFSADTSFAIEHVYGHHAQVCTMDDPATARRGEGFYAFAWRSTINSYVHAYHMEKTRLAKFGKSVWNPLVSPFMFGNLLNLVPAIIAFVLAGFVGVAVWIVIALISKQLLESQNYFAHYGFVREKGKPVQPYHSWNSNHWLSTNVLYSLARHSHHHAQADQPYWKLKAMPEAPQLPYGYLTMVVLTLVPPLFKHLMTPGLNDWDKNWASPAERELARQASVNSGMKGLDLAKPVLA